MDSGLAAVCMSDVARRGSKNAQGDCVNAQTHGNFEGTLAPCV